MRKRHRGLHPAGARSAQSRHIFRRWPTSIARCSRKFDRLKRGSIATRRSASTLRASAKRCGSFAGDWNTLPTQPPPARRCADSPEEGRYGTCTEVWFLKLDASVDHLLAPDFKGKPPRFLDRINDPDRLERYLESLLVSRFPEDGVDHRKELNFASANLVRLILWRRPANYRWDPRLEPVIRRFVADWQDPATGFFGATYEIGGQRFRTTDLSMTFHMARYLEGKINYWQQLIDTLLEIRDDRYPNGWLDDEGLTSHNNYDVATLFQLGWPEMRADQRQCAGTELDRLLSWCLATAITPDGAVVARAKSESMVEGYYFTIAFLDTIGYFDPAKRFWTDRAFPEAPVLQAQLEPNVRRLHPNDPMARMSLERLGSR